MNNLLALNFFEVLGIVFIVILVLSFVILLWLFVKAVRDVDETERIAATKKVTDTASEKEETKTEEFPAEEIAALEELADETQKQEFERYTEETATRDILVSMLKSAGIKGISKMKKSELIAKVKENNLEYPEVKRED